MSRVRTLLLITLFVPATFAATRVDSGPPFGVLPLIDEIDCAASPAVEFIELPTGASRVKSVFGQPCRVLPPRNGSAAVVGWRIGRGKGLVAGRAYLLCVDYPEDTARSFHVANWGCETVKGVATGAAMGDVLIGRYVHANPESIQYPLSGKYETWRQLFFLHDHTPGVARPPGYFVSDVEAAGPFSMAAEAWAVANGDPCELGYLTGNSFNRGFPVYARDFDAAFLSLPALPSTRLAGASSDPNVVVRAIPTPRDVTWLAVVNTGFVAKQDVVLTLPRVGTVTDAPTGRPLSAHGTRLTLSLGPCQLRALHLK